MSHSPIPASRRAILAAALTVLLTPAQSSFAAKPVFPLLEFPAAAQGERAVEMLAQHLPAVARWYNKTPEEFASMLRRDPHARIDRNGRLHYVDGHTVDQAPAAQQGAAPQAAAFPLEQTFLLHSRPGAQRTIYLDFDGHTVTNSAWNGYVGSSTIDAQPFDIDGVPFTFSQTELERIQGIWQRVAEDYAPFDVDVTTEAPPPGALERSGSADPVFGTRVVITRDFVPGGCGCGGFAYVGVFDMTTEYYKPAFVFFDRLGNGYEKYVAEAVSHEAGHNVGLNHDGSTGSAYYAGHGSGETGWAPIMGVGYYQPLVQWSRGEYANASNREDDFAMMQANELPLRADDHGDSAATAAAMTGSGSLAASGVIERAADVDVFRFSAEAGAASAALAFTSPAPNLDALLELVDGSGKVLASSNPESQLAASLATTLPAPGTYYLRVSGVGKGNALADGYTDYGSLGEYVLSAEVGSSGNAAPVAVAQASPASGPAPLSVSLEGAGSYDPDGSIVSWQWDLGDGSAPVASARVQHVYAQGSYLATLTVTDAGGLSGSSSVTIDASGPVAVPVMHVQSIVIELSGNKRNTAAVASVAVRDDSGNPVAGAIVSGTWSGEVSGTASGTTDSAGIATIRSPRARSKGSFTFTVTGVALTGYAYDASQNQETSDSASN